MADNTPEMGTPATSATPEAAPNDTAAAGSETSAEKAQPKTYDEAHVSKLNKEAEARRHENAELKKRLKAIEDAQLSETEKLKRDLEDLSPKAQRAERLETLLTKQLEAQKSALAPHGQKLVEKLAEKLDTADLLEWISENAADLRAPISSASPTNPARGGGPLTAEAQLDSAWSKRGGGSSFRI